MTLSGFTCSFLLIFGSTARPERDGGREKDLHDRPIHPRRFEAPLSQRVARQITQFRVVSNRLAIARDSLFVDGDGSRDVAFDAIAAQLGWIFRFDLVQNARRDEG